MAEQAVLVLTHLRCGDTYARLAAGFRIGIATAHRYIRQAVDPLAAFALTLEQASIKDPAENVLIASECLAPSSDWGTVSLASLRDRRSAHRCRN
ncbi:hypothetical protein JOC24_003840 [Streptomyces sp. HB132]|nr:hypothetical protein [Streptomyces sp. HB132]